MLLAFLTICLITMYCFNTAFYSNPHRKEDFHDLPNTKQYMPYYNEMSELVDHLVNEPYEQVTTKSFDGLTLRGRLYMYDENAPIDITFNGYRTSGVHDSGGIFKLVRHIGHNVLVVDQRATGKSDGKVISFGINERYDVLSWVTYLNKRFNKKMKIVLIGGSLGGATVLMASELKLPENVVGIIADSAYTSPKAIIKKEISEMHLPVNITYTFVKFAAKVMGHFEIESSSPLKAVQHAKIPILMIHGEADHYVPCNMARKNYAACQAPYKELLTVPNGPHDISLLTDWDTYEKTVYDFFKMIGVKN